jgi:hypothetical protein
VTKVPGTPTRAGDLPAPDDLVWNPENPLKVNMCSKRANAHEPDCDGNCGYEELDELDVQINNERFAWMRAGLGTDMIPHNVFHMSNQIDALIEVLGYTEDSKFSDAYRRILLNKLKAFRAVHEEDFRKARLAAQLGVGRKPIIGPNGGILQ